MASPKKTSENEFLKKFQINECMILDKILSDHGLYAPYDMMNNFQYVITLPKSSKIMVAQSGESVGNYSLENLELEYETIENLDLTNDVLSNYSSGRSLSYNYDSYENRRMGQRCDFTQYKYQYSMKKYESNCVTL